MQNRRTAGRPRPGRTAVAAGLLAAAASLLHTQTPVAAHARHGRGPLGASAADSSLSGKARAQIDAARRATARFATPEAAEDAGYVPVFGMVPLQGVHYVHADLVERGSFDPTRPSVLMYSTVNGKPTLVGVAYAYQHPRNQPVPTGFDGPNDDWHAHDELSREEGRHIVMVHLWLVDSPGGPFARYNPYLPYMAASLAPPSAAELTAKTPRGERARRFAFALAIATHPPQFFDLVESRGGPELARAAFPHRRALGGMVKKLEGASRKRDRAAYGRLVSETIAHSDSLMAVYRGTVRSPRARQAIDRMLDELMGKGHEGHESMPGTTHRQ